MARLVRREIRVRRSFLGIILLVARLISSAGVGSIRVRRSFLGIILLVARSEIRVILLIRCQSCQW